MISRQGLDALIADYSMALNMVNDVANALEDGAARLGALGYECSRDAVRASDQANGLYRAISRVHSRIREVTPDDRF